MSTLRRRREHFHNSVQQTNRSYPTFYQVTDKKTNGKLNVKGLQCIHNFKTN